MGHAGGTKYMLRGQTTCATPKQSAASASETAHEGQALRTLSLCAARFGRPLRSRERALRVREVRPRTKAERHQPLPTQDREEARMRNSPKYPWNVATKRCAVCDGKFGLIRHYSWRTALCSKKCVGRFKARQEGDHRWLRGLHSAAWQQVQ